MLHIDVVLSTISIATVPDDVVIIGNYTLNNFGFVSIINYPNNFKDYPIGKLGLGYKQDHGDEFNFGLDIRNHIVFQTVDATTHFLDFVS